MEKIHHKPSNHLNTDMYRWAALGFLLVLVYSSSLLNLVVQWWDSPEYGHGLFMPIIAGYIVWRNRRAITLAPLESSSLGYLVLFPSLLLFVTATLADIESAKQYSFCGALVGYIMLLGGWKLLRICLLPITLIVLVIPLPYLLISSLTASLQLISSELGTWMIRAFGISVFLEGNIIDLGVYKLQVVEACSGLRYLYPLLSISLLVTYFLKTPLWFKSFIVLSAIPITIVMNSLRIAITGLLVNSYGNEVAEGFLHDFEGWVVFLAAFVCLMAEVWAFRVVFHRSGKLYDLFGFETPESAAGPLISLCSRFSFMNAFLLISLIGGAAVYFDLTAETEIPARKTFLEFPMRIDDRNVTLDSFEQDVLDILRPDDYFIGSYGGTGSNPIGLYMVYYAQQKDGSALHSPKVCIPGGGWIVEDDNVISFDVHGTAMSVNRVVIRKGEVTQLVYYWIDQMGVSYTNEYLARASLIESALTLNRSDGSLVRVNVTVEDDDFATADLELQRFVKDMVVTLPGFLPH